MLMLQRVAKARAQLLASEPFASRSIGSADCHTLLLLRLPPRPAEGGGAGEAAGGTLCFVDAAALAEGGAPEEPSLEGLMRCLEKRKE